MNLRVRLLPVFDDVNRGFLGGCCASADTDVLGDQFRLSVFAKPHVRRDKSTRSHAANLTSLKKFGLALGVVGALLLGFVQGDINPRCRIRLFLGEHLVHAFRRAKGAASIGPLGRRIPLVEHVVDAALDEGVLRLKLVLFLHAVFARRRAGPIGGTHDLLAKLSRGQWLVMARGAQIALTNWAMACSGRWWAISASLTMPTRR